MTEGYLWKILPQWQNNNSGIGSGCMQNLISCWNLTPCGFKCIEILRENHFIHYLFNSLFENNQFLSPTIHDRNILHSFLLEPSVSKRRCDTRGMNISGEYLHNTQTTMTKLNALWIAQRNCNKKTVLGI